MFFVITLWNHESEVVETFYSNDPWEVLFDATDKYPDHVIINIERKGS